MKRSRKDEEEIPAKKKINTETGDADLKGKNKDEAINEETLKLEDKVQEDEPEKTSTNVQVLPQDQNGEKKTNEDEQNFFKDFDLENFFSAEGYAIENYQSSPPTLELIEEIENELGYKLPKSYIAMMNFRNGGVPQKTCFSLGEDNWVEVEGIMGIGREKDNSLGGDSGSKFWMDEWEYPDIGIYFADCPSAGHDMFCFDYSKCGKDGEPEVVHIDQEMDYRVTLIAKDFASFVQQLKSADELEKE